MRTARQAGLDKRTPDSVHNFADEASLKSDSPPPCAVAARSLAAQQSETQQAPVKLEPEALARHQKFDFLFDFGNGREIRLAQLLVNFRQSRLFELCPFANPRFDLLA